MKTFIPAAIIIAVACIALASCEWLFGNKPKSIANTHTINGTWQIKSMADSSANARNTTPMLAAAFSNNDTLPVSISFNIDSTFTISSKNDSIYNKGIYYVDTAKQTIFIKEDSLYTPYSIKQWSDTAVQLYTAKDSITYTLIKQ
ncbi:DUF5004 domain-containing protein [Limnovirga soli]|uniref:Lipocalin-like domain-containing protein n=1 Tax=Limnovirga soli TaxID=2656915 RepID=A0A8J8FDP0_9BACT|nr:DUF5004 domain-containing protein [Limnovirga soli]NNV54727.1 hypothetical protein [Limnovirga soli]